MQTQVNHLHRFRIEPLAEQQFGFFIGTTEVTRWHFSELSPRPYFFPILGKSGQSLTRMGHPGAPNHDHHRSFWFAHSDLLGMDFWSEGKPTRIRQAQWYAIEDGSNDGHDPSPLLLQDVFATIRGEPGEWTLELQSDFRTQSEGIEFRQSNFGVLGLRVAKSLSVIFGGGRITGENGLLGEADLFGKPNRWIDYSGPVYARDLAAGEVPDSVIEGLTLIDHRDNPDHPVSWHVREDGWIGPSLSRKRPILVPKGTPLTCRYLLSVHAGPCDADKANLLANRFDLSPRLGIRKSDRPHHQYAILPMKAG
jgi:Methane oxygenase PmoA